MTSRSLLSTLVLITSLVVDASAHAQDATEPQPGSESASDSDSDTDSDSDSDSDSAAETRSAKAPASSGEEASVDRFRNPVQTLSEHFLGSTSRPVRFDWRKSPAGFGVIGSELIERNNFGSFRLGGLARRAFADVMVELAVTWVFVLPTQSSELLSLTPYHQAGRPSRLELDINAGYPLAEAVVTPVLWFIPPAELVLSVVGGLRYLAYLESYRAFSDNPDALDIGAAILSPALSDEEVRQLERSAPGGMQIDTGRYHLMAGLALDLYLQPGVFISPRAQLSIPLLAPISGSRLGLWWEMSLVLGYAL